MKMPNGYGSVYKLSGKRRKPFIARKTTGWCVDASTGKAKQLYATVGYYATRAEALQALAIYNEDPYDLHADTITFEDVYKKWSEEHFQEVTASSVRSWISAYNHSAPLHKMRFKDIRPVHMERAIKGAEVGSATKGRMKSMYNLMYRYAMKHDIVDRDYAALCDGVKREQPKIIREPFSDEELAALWSEESFPFVDTVLIGIYTGFRPQELAELKIADVDLEAKTMRGGLKTDAGRNRVVPIHSKIFSLVNRNYEKSATQNCEKLFLDENDAPLTYDKYRNRFIKVMQHMKQTHKPHDTRHTFITMAKAANMDEYILKLIVGHAIRDVTEDVYTHRTLEQLHAEIEKIK